MRRTLALALTLTIASHAVSADPLEEFTNSIGMKFKLIPAGEFMMGNSESLEELDRAFPHSRPDWFHRKRPQHQVRITKPFYLGVTEVTQKQYKAVMGDNPSCFSKTGERANHVKGLDTSELPVEQVVCADAVEFCRKLSAKEGCTYRLPTEAEWEYACRAGSTKRFSFGDEAARLGDYAWFSENSAQRPHAVGQKKPNAWGMHDMHGNVFEWCSDWFGEDYYANSPVDDPGGPTAGSYRVTRGGCWARRARLCLSSYRNINNPSFRDFFHVGFRVARAPSVSKPESE